MTHGPLDLRPWVPIRPEDRQVLMLELHVLARAGHDCFRERPEAFERVLTSFCLER